MLYTYIDIVTELKQCNTVKLLINIAEILFMVSMFVYRCLKRQDCDSAVAFDQITSASLISYRSYT